LTRNEKQSKKWIILGKEIVNQYILALAGIVNYREKAIKVLGIGENDIHEWEGNFRVAEDKDPDLVDFVNHLIALFNE